MKNGIKLMSMVALLIIGCSTFFIFATKPADDKPETITVRLERPFITVHYGGNKMEKTKFKPKEDADQVLDVVQKLNADGYKVISESTCREGENGGFKVET